MYDTYYAEGMEYIAVAYSTEWHSRVHQRHNRVLHIALTRSTPGMYYCVVLWYLVYT